LNKQLLPKGTKIKFVKLVEVEYPGNFHACWEPANKRDFKDLGRIPGWEGELHKMIQKDSVRSSRWRKGICR
jgi:hypothetical protein